MKKLIFITLFGFLGFNNISIADEISSESIESPDKAAQNIINTSVKNLKDLYKNNTSITKDNVDELIRNKFVPFVNANFAAEKSLKKYWNNLNKNQKNNLTNYIINSLINDYSNVLTTYKNIDGIKITADKNIKKKNNLAIVKLNINQPNTDEIVIITKMIKTDIWRIYDVVVSGVSLVKNYEQQFNSYIKRKGFDNFANKFLN